jgi:hypothetical protein
VWRNPKYFPTASEAPPSPPVDTARRLATLPRGQGAEMRLALAEYEGKPYVSLRVFERGSDGQLWPMRGKGCSIRISEVAEVIAALRQVEDLVAGMAQGTHQDARQRGDGAATPDRTPGPHERSGAPPAAQDDAPRYIERRGRPRPREFDGSGLQPPREGERFDEFE